MSVKPTDRPSEQAALECICHKGHLCTKVGCGLYHHKDCPIHRDYHAARPSEGQHKFCEPSSQANICHAAIYPDDVCGQPREASIHQVESEGQQAAPERIWIERQPEDGYCRQTWFPEKPRQGRRYAYETVEYVRAGLHTVSDAACPHCFGERSLGDCQVTQRLHAEALAKVTSDAAEAQPISRVECNYCNHTYVPTCPKCGCGFIKLAATRQASTGRVWDEAIRIVREDWLAAYPLSVFPEPPPPPAECPRDLIAAAMGRHIATRLIEQFEAARNLDTSEADNFTDET